MAREVVVVGMESKEAQPNGAVETIEFDDAVITVTTLHSYVW